MKKRWVITGLLLILLGTAWPWGQSTFHSWRQRRLLAQASDYFQHDQFSEALFTARRAASLDPPSPDACRLVARLLESIRSTNALAWRERVIALEPDFASNRFDFAWSALSLQQVELAGRSLAALPKSSQANADFHRAASALALATNNPAAAEAHLVQAAQCAPGDPAHAFNLAVFQLASTNPSVARASAVALERIPAHSTFRLPALRSLVSSASGQQDFVMAQKFSGELVAHPAAEFDDRLSHLNLLHAISHPSRNSFLSETQRAAGTNAAAIFTLSSWMIAHQDASAALDWIRRLPVSLRARQPIPIALADCQVALGLWAELQRDLPAQQWHAMDFLRSALLSRAFREQNLHAHSRLEWQKALRHAGTRPAPLRSLHDISRAWSWEIECQEVLSALVKNHPRETWAARRLHELCLARRDSASLCDLFQWLSAAAPADLSLKNNLARLSLLLPRNLSRAHELAAEVNRQEPHNPDYAVTRAYSLHLQKRTEDALGLLEALPAHAREHPLIANYRAVLLAATGQLDQARQSLCVVPVSLFPEEEILFDQTRALLVKSQLPDSK